MSRDSMSPLCIFQYFHFYIKIFNQFHHKEQFAVYRIFFAFLILCLNIFSDNMCKHLFRCYVMQPGVCANILSIFDSVCADVLTISASVCEKIRLICAGVNADIQQFVQVFMQIFSEFVQVFVHNPHQRMGHMSGRMVASQGNHEISMLNINQRILRWAAQNQRTDIFVV